MIKRQLEPILKLMADKMPIISITGPRQSGKTTLSKKCFPDHKYLNLEAPDIRLMAQEDPRAFLKDSSEGMILDEVQRVPELFSYIQAVSDEMRTPGKLILTGSENYLLKRSISQSLAGRVFLSTLLPLSISEITSAQKISEDVDELIWKGGYPRLYDFEISPSLFYPSYIQTYLERDITSQIQPSNLILFRKFLDLLAGRSGQLINYSSLAIEVGVDFKTIQYWCSILEASHIIFLLKPYHQNFSKRIIKSAKLYFYDTGLVCSLLGIHKAADLKLHWAKGALFENLVLSEIMKYCFNNAIPPSIYFWRENNGIEIDVVIEQGGRVSALEIKSGRTFQASFLRNLNAFKKISASHVVTYLVYGGDTSVQIQETIIQPWFQLQRILKSIFK